MLISTLKTCTYAHALHRKANLIIYQFHRGKKHLEDFECLHISQN